MTRRGLVASLCGAMLFGLVTGCAESSPRTTGGDGSGTAKSEKSAAAPGDTVGREPPAPSASPSVTSIPTPGPVNRPSAAVSRLIDRLTPAQFALNEAGYLLIAYADYDYGIKSAWRLYGPDDTVIAEGRNGASPEVAGRGFLLFRNSPKFLDRRGRLTQVAYRPRRPVGRGDLLLPGRGAFNLRSKELFTGTAKPNGVATLIDDKGRFWALGRGTEDRTVVRFARPGGAWKSRDLGPRIYAQQVTGKGNVIMVTGRRRMYLSTDSGQSWRLLTHGASVYSGIPEFGLTREGSILAGDSRAGFRISRDFETFQDLTMAEGMDLAYGAQTRVHKGETQLSRDGMQWETFTVAKLRSLLG